MADNLILDKIKELKKENPENLRTKYSTLQAYINSVVTFRFTTLGFFLAALALILSGTPSFGKYLLLSLITIALYIIELRNRFLKNELDVQAKQIEQKWGYIKDCELIPTTIFGMVIDKRDNRFLSFLSPKITHSLGLDILYLSVLVYALCHVISLLFFPLFFYH